MTKSGVSRALQTLSHDLGKVFEETFDRINEQLPSRQKIAVDSMMFISYARRTLSIDELRHALTLRVEDADLARDNLLPARAIIESCSDLVVIDNESSTIRFVHHTLQEFLVNHRQYVFKFGESYFNNICLKYLLLDSVVESFERRTWDFATTQADFPFYLYAARYCGYHAHNVPSENIKDLAMKFLRSYPHLMCAARVRDSQMSRYLNYRSAADMHSSDPGMLTAARFGLTYSLDLLIKAGADIESSDTFGNTALHTAALGRHCETVQFLLEKGAELDVTNSEINTPLFLATSKDHFETVQVLLDKGADPGASCKDGWTALHKAADNGNEAVVKLLISRDVYIRTTSTYGLTVLHRAAGRGHLGVIKLLLDHGCPLDSTTYDGWTPLHRAASAEQDATVRLLLNNGAKINYQSEDRLTPLHRACRRVHRATVSELLE